MQRTLLALALIVTAGASYAQTMQTNEPRDPYGRPMVGRNDYVPQPGDQRGAAPSANMNMGNASMNSGGNASVATAPTTFTGTPPTYEKSTNNNKLERTHAIGPEPMPAQTGPRQAASKDEYGFRYDSDGNRLDARGNVISPHIPQRR
jgi:hypothetical protein